MSNKFSTLALGAMLGILPGEEWLQRGQVERHPSVQDVVGEALKRDDAEQLA